MGESWDFGQDMLTLEDLDNDELLDVIEESEWLGFDINEGVSVRSVLLARQTKEKIRLAMHNAKARKEWAGFMDIVGHKDGHPVFGNLQVPDQIPLPATVNFQVEDPGYGKPAAIHSHHTMGTFHSGVDDCGVDANNDISIVVAWGENRSIESKARVRVLTESDRIVRTYTDIEVVDAGYMSDFVEEFTDSLKEAPNDIQTGRQLANQSQQQGLYGR